MNFGSNKTPVEMIREGAFGGIYFRDICSGINDKWYKKSWKEFDQLKDTDRSIIAKIIIMSVSTNMVLNAEYH